MTETTTTTETIVDVDAIEEQTAIVVRDALAIEITDGASYEMAGAFLVEGIKAGLAAIADLFDPIEDAQKAARKVTIAQRRALEDPLKEGEKIIKRSMGAYDQEQRRLAAIAEQEAIDAAKKAAEDAAVAEAARLETAGHDEAAAERLATPVVPTLPTPAPAAPQVKGVSTRVVTKFKITDPSKISRDFMVPDEKKIGQVVRAMGADAATLVGGIEIFEETVVAARAR